MLPLYQQAPFPGDLYRQSLALREQVLRIPLGMKTRPEDTAEDHLQQHYVALMQGQVIATVSLVPPNASYAKLRQMAVSPEYRGKGIGAGLLGYVHQQAKSLGYSHVRLNARDSAIRFYEKLGYVSIGERFQEIGLEHQQMEKRL